MTPLLVLFAHVQISITSSPPVEARTTAARHLEAALAAVGAEASQLSDIQRAARMRDAAREAAKELGERSLVSSRLTALATGLEPLAGLRRNALEIATDLVFSPVVEAGRPRGFPGATPVGEVLVLDYPACRLARVPMDRGWGAENGAFWKLFQHIESNKIPMTAPVEMTYADSAERQTTMAFLYASTDVGRLGPAGRDVEVADVPPMRVASFGVRGRRTDERVREARRAIEGWLSGRTGLEAAGSLRVMGWNGPMTPVARSYFEVQIPVRTVAHRLRSPQGGDAASSPGTTQGRGVGR